MSIPAGPPAAGFVPETYHGGVFLRRHLSALVLAVGVLVAPHAQAASIDITYAINVDFNEFQFGSPRSGEGDGAQAASAAPQPEPSWRDAVGDPDLRRQLHRYNSVEESDLARTQIPKAGPNRIDFRQRLRHVLATQFNIELTE